MNRLEKGAYQDVFCNQIFDVFREGKKSWRYAIHGGIEPLKTYPTKKLAASAARMAILGAARDSRESYDD